GIQAQTHRASVRGTVVDGNGAAIVGATLELTNKATNERRSMTSGANGEYSISSLAPGTYTVRVSAPNFTPRVLDITLFVNQYTRLDPHIQPGPVDYFVTTTDPNLKKDSPALGTVIENRQVKGLPLDGRNFYELSLLVPGAVPPAPGSAGSVRGDFSFSVNG